MALSDNFKGAALMTASMVIFTTNDAAMKAATETLPPIEAIALRGAIAFGILAMIGLSTRNLRLPTDGRDRLWLFLRSVGEVGSTLAFVTALKHMPLANLSAILQSLPLAVTLAAAVFLGLPVGWRRLSAIGVGFIGVLLIVRPGTAGFDRWSILGLICVALVVLRDLSTRKLSRDVASSTVAVAASGSVFLAALCLLPFTEIVVPSARATLYILLASLLVVVGYMTAVMTMRVGDIAFSAPFRYTSLVAAIFLGWLFFGEFPDELTLLGGAIVVATGIYTFYRERQTHMRAMAEADPI